MGTAGPRRANWTVIGIVSIPFGYEYSGPFLTLTLAFHKLLLTTLNRSYSFSCKLEIDSSLSSTNSLLLNLVWSSIFTLFIYKLCLRRGGRKG
jgi:hypothetical protein